MILSDVSIRRPVLATVMSILILLVGAVSYKDLTVREYPDIDPPVVNIETDYDGASSDIVETQVTQVLEESIAGIEGVDFTSSISRPENSQITVTFRLGRDTNEAANDVRDRVSRVRGLLPDAVDDPIIRRVEADAQPIIYLALGSDHHNAAELTDYADRYIKDQIQTLPGVAQAMILGERRYAMRVWIDPLRLASYNLTVQDVESALRSQNVEVPAGRIESSQREFTVRSMTDMQTPEQFNDLIIRSTGGYLVRLSDVGHAELGVETERIITRFQGRNLVALGVVKQATANPLEVSEWTQRKVEEIAGRLPEGMNLEVAYDSSVFIDESVNNVFHAIGEAIILVVLIIFLFLRSFRAILIPVVTIPVALIGTFGIMLAVGFSINTLTLLGLVLAVGLVVDDAIVVLENIHRHVESGMPRMKAALLGSKEIGFAIVAMTLTLASVYAPIGFMSGTTGRLFTEFAWTVAGAVLVSGFVALTLSPMMCSKLLRHQKRHNFLYNFFERGLTGLVDGYRILLTWALKVRFLVLLVGVGVAGCGYWIFMHVNSELAPIEDRGAIMTIGIAPEGATIDYTDRYLKQMEGVLAQVPEREKQFAVAGYPEVTQGIAILDLADWKDRDRSQMQIVRELFPRMLGIPGVLAFPLNPPSLGQQFGKKPVQFVIRSTHSYRELEEIVQKFLAEIRKNPNLLNVDTDLKLNKPQLEVSVDRDKVADMGIAVRTVGETLQTFLGGRDVTRFKRDGEQYDVIVKLADVDRRNPDDIKNVFIRAANGQMVSISNMVSLEESVTPKALNHFDQLRSATIDANLAPGYTLGQALQFFQDTAGQVLPDTVLTDYAGESREFRDSNTNMTLVFGLALAFIFLLLAAQFESFIDPFIIMLTVPLSLTGALLALYLHGFTLNIYSQVGIVTLIGLITKHGILLVEFANQMREQGDDVFTAAIDAAVLRLRPILMTTGAMVLGSVPLAYATGAGAESRQAIGWVIVGGLLVGTFFTLFVIPAVYTMVASREKAHHEESASAEPEAAD